MYVGRGYISERNSAIGRRWPTVFCSLHVLLVLCGGADCLFLSTVISISRWCTNIVLFRGALMSFLRAPLSFLRAPLSTESLCLSLYLFFTGLINHSAIYLFT